MDTEFEVKFYPVDKDEIRKKLKKLGGKLIQSEIKMRRVLADRRHNHWMTCHYVRVRDEGKVVMLAVKTHAEEGGKIEDQKELEIKVDDFDETVNLLKASGINFTYYQENFREVWELDGTEVFIDIWPGALPRLEIEADSEGAIKKIAQKLGLNWEKKIVTAMAEVYARIYGLSLDETLERMSNLTFENNPFKNLKKIWP